MGIVEFADPAVPEFLAQPKDIQARLERYIAIIESRGINVLHEPHAKHLRGPLWELRLKGKDGIARAIYVTRTGRRVLVVRVFTKKTEKTPRRELDLALRRAKEAE